MKYLTTVGLETHVQLRTHSKIWCGCPNRSDSDPNTDVCPVCLGYPGVMPVLNEEAVRLTVMTGMMLNCQINLYSKFDRKSYFYPDMPKNYQISQYDQPFCEHGSLHITLEDGRTKDIRICRIHLEEDVGKSIHQTSSSLVDFNRAGTPLMEIVTEPDIEDEEEAFAYLQALKQILQYGEISDCNLEQGNIRCDVNCSIRPEGQEELGTKAEIKNMNTFKGVHRALRYEIKRQNDVLKKGGSISQETRRWDDEAGITSSMRSKEYAHDYRYFPDPDLMPVTLEQSVVDAWKKALPELPSARRERMQKEYGLPEYDAGVLAADKEIADFYEAAAAKTNQYKALSNWIMTEIMRVLSESDLTVQEIKVQPEHMAELVDLIGKGTLNSTKAKEVFADMLESGEMPAGIVERKGLAQVSDTGAIDSFVEEAISENPKSVEDYKAGKGAAIQFLMGQVMRKSKGKANPGVVMHALKTRLG